MGLNIVIQQGRLVADPVIYSGTSEKGDYIYARFRLAVPRDYKEKDGTKITDFKTCEATGQNAKFIQEYYRKGDLVVVVGSWYTKDHKKNGEKRNYDYLSVQHTYPSMLKGAEKPLEENLADTKKLGTMVLELDEGHSYDMDELPPLPEEYQKMFK